MHAAAAMHPAEHALSASSTPDPDASLRVLCYVQYVHGVGHLQRINAVARDLTRHTTAITRVTLVVGGLPIPALRDALVAEGIEYVQLPPCSQPPGGWHLVDASTGIKIDRAWKAKRRSLLLATLHRVVPHVLLVEMYPFGRRMFHWELTPLLDAAYAMATPQSRAVSDGSAPAAGLRPAVIVSVRDYLVRKIKPKPHTTATCVGVIRAYVDQVLVHGDPSLLAFGESFEGADSIAAKIAYTGYVVVRIFLLN